MEEAMNKTLTVGNVTFGNGEWRKYKNKVQFYDQKKNPWFALIKNRFGSLFFVETAYTPEGKMWYFQSTCSTTDEKIGLTFKMKSEIAETLWDEAGGKLR
jgi:hypothetical protein